MLLYSLDRLELVQVLMPVCLWMAQRTMRYINWQWYVVCSVGHGMCVSTVTVLLHGGSCLPCIANSNNWVHVNRLMSRTRKSVLPLIMVPLTRKALCNTQHCRQYAHIHWKIDPNWYSNSSYYTMGLAKKTTLGIIQCHMNIWVHLYSI